MTAPIPPGYPTPEPNTGRQWWQKLWVQLTVGALVIFIVGAAIGSASKSSSKTTAAQVSASAQPPSTVTATMPVPGETATVSSVVTQTATATVTTTYTPTPVAAFSGNGIYLVGKDVQPGTYRSAGPEAGAGECYYELDTQGGDIISNDGGTGQEIVRVPSSAYTLKVDGCQDFTAA